MVLTPRRRAFLAVVLSWPLGTLYVYLAGHLAFGLAQQSRSGSVECADGPLRLLDRYNGCGLGAPGLGGSSFRTGYVWLELLVLSAAAAAVAYGLARGSSGRWARSRTPSTGSGRPAWACGCARPARRTRPAG